MWNKAVMSAGDCKSRNHCFMSNPDGYITRKKKLSNPLICKKKKFKPTESAPRQH